MAASSRFSSPIIPSEGLTFDDVLLLPGYTDFRREEVDLTVKLHPDLTLRLPIISSPMDTVTESAMAILMAQSGGLGIIHRNLGVEMQADMVRAVKRSKIQDPKIVALDRSGRLLVGAAVGAGSDLEERVRTLIDAEVDVIVVDSGHGHSQFILDAVSYVKKKAKGVVIIGGNVATAEGAKAMIKAGADVIRVGVGPGSICTTRVVTGVGVPQLTAIMEAVKGVKGSNVTVIADGGIKQMGDMAKAFGAGAHAVMLGSMLAGHTESPGEQVSIDGKTYKQYRGMGSIGAMKKGGAERYGQSKDTEAKKLIAEGVEGLVPFKGSAGDFLYQAAGALRSACYYIGAQKIADFGKNAKMVKMSGAGLRESHPHTISVVDAGASYLRN